MMILTHNDFGKALRDSAIADISKNEAFEGGNDANGSTHPSTNFCCIYY
jgi:hypothetical protein